MLGAFSRVSCGSWPSQLHLFCVLCCSHWSEACPNIKAAIKKLDKLLRRVKVGGVRLLLLGTSWCCWWQGQWQKQWQKQWQQSLWMHGVAVV